MNETIGDLINYLNQSGGIPLIVKTSQQTNWWQFGFNAVISVLGMFFIFFYLFGFLKMGYQNKSVKSSLKKFRKLTGKPVLLIKHTDASLFSSSMIDQATLRKVTMALNEFNGKEFNLILHTPGGEVFSAMYISRLLKDYPGKINAIIPLYAMSGGTLLALSCNSLVLDNASCLGCVDPQLGTLFKFGSAKSFNHILKFKGKKAEDSTISLAMVGAQYTKTIYEHIYSLLSRNTDKKNAKKVANMLTSGDLEHAHAFLPKDVKQWGMKVHDLSNPTLKDLLYKIVAGRGKEGTHYLP